jgi:hypothetical protein
VTWHTWLSKSVPTSYTYRSKYPTLTSSQTHCPCLACSAILDLPHISSDKAFFHLTRWSRWLPS